MIRLYLLVAAFSTALLYGSTYQQFRFFTLENPGGATDAIHYVDMATGAVIEEPEVRHYRWVTPAAARLIQPLAGLVVPDRDLSIRLAFYLVNFAFSLLTCLVFFSLLQSLGYSVLLSLLGISAFAGSRITVMATGTPLVDAAYFCAIAITVWLAVERKTLALALLLPVLALTKETILPFLLLPLLTEMRKAPALWVSLAVAAAGLVISDRVVGSYYAADSVSLAATIVAHAAEVGGSVRRIFTLGGIHDLQNGFSLLLPLGGFGAWLNARYRYHDIPIVVKATLPIAIVLALLSGNLGRMLFAAFPAVIAFALIAIEHVAGQGETDSQEPE